MNEIKLPSSWDEISLSQFIELKKLDEVDSSFFVRNIDIFSIITDTDSSDEYWEDMDITEVEGLVKYLKWLEIIPSTEPKTKIDEFILKDINKLTFGEFIDLEHFFMADYIENLNSIVAILYRRKLASTDYFTNDKLEPYGNWLHHRATIMNDAVGVGDVFGIVNKYLSFRANIFKLYEGLFDGGGEDIDEEDIDEEETKKPKEKDNSGKWGWDIMLLKIANNDALKIEEASNIPLIQAFNVLAMRKELKIE
jgi:hypothetical protein